MVNKSKSISFERGPDYWANYAFSFKLVIPSEKTQQVCLYEILREGELGNTKDEDSLIAQVSYATWNLLKKTVKYRIKQRMKVYEFPDEMICRFEPGINLLPRESGKELAVLLSVCPLTGTVIKGVGDEEIAWIQDRWRDTPTVDLWWWYNQITRRSRPDSTSGALVAAFMFFSNMEVREVCISK